MGESITDKYLGIPFKDKGKDFNGVYCYGLVQLFYRIEKGIILPEIHGLRKICEEIEKPEKHCFVTFTDLCGESQEHIGIMLNEIWFLHISNNSKRHIRFPVLEKIIDRLWKKRFYGYHRVRKDAEINRI